MNKQDSNGVRTAQDLERKYNFSKMLGLSKNVETNEKTLLVVQNELNNMLNALVINLKDVLDDQSDISLWFYSGTPTLENEPYTSWVNIGDHVGDIYYDKNTGYVYQFKSVVNGSETIYLWELNTTPDLIEAMAITNSETDTSTDHERKVFFTSPIPPYSNGDWWIKQDGSLFVCQISKNIPEIYSEDDFIAINNYTESVAEKISDEIKVLKGTITKMTEDYVKFTDLSTGGSTTIAGENISTGSIKSNNYQVNTTGMKIDLLNGIIDSKNFKTDTYGNVYLGTGAKVIGGDGMLTNLQFISTNGRPYQFGANLDYSGQTPRYKASPIKVYADIPDNFTIVESILTLIHIPVKWQNSIWGYARNIGVNSQALDEQWILSFNGDMAFITEPTLTPYTEIFDGNDTWQPSTPTNVNYPIEIVQTSDLHLTNGFNVLDIRTTTPPTGTASLEAMTQECERNSGMLMAILDVYGYMSIDNNS